MDLIPETLEFIKIEKAKLNDLILEKGLNHKDTIYQSQKLDRLILVVQSQIVDREIKNYQTA